MNFYLANSPDHAFLALAIQEGARAASNRGTTLGRTAVQKIVYFMRICGVPVNYKFDIHHYGPFCSTILRDCEWLEADDVIADASENPARSDYQRGEAFDCFISKFNDLVEPYRQTIAAIADVFGPLSPKSLEVYATIDFVYREVKARGTSKADIEREVLERFQKIKASKYPSATVESAYKQMQDLGLIQ